MRETHTREIQFSERGFVERLGLNEPEVLGVRAIYINGRYVTVPEKIEEIVVVLNVLGEEEDAEEEGAS